MAGHIFLNYRRDDSKFAAGRLYDRLRQTFEEADLFMDVDNIPDGADFKTVLDEHVAKCDVFLAIIGPSWLTLTGPDGQRRIDNPDDFVRIEIEAALQRGIRVIPVLVDRASLPVADELPHLLKPLVERQARAITYERFGQDSAELVRQINLALTQARAKKLGVFGPLAGLWDKPTEPAQESKLQKPVATVPSVAATAASSLLSVVHAAFWVGVVGLATNGPAIARSFGAPIDSRVAEQMSALISGGLLVLLWLSWMAVRKKIGFVAGIAFAVCLALILGEIGRFAGSVAPQLGPKQGTTVGLFAALALTLYVGLRRLAYRRSHQ